MKNLALAMLIALGTCGVSIADVEQDPQLPDPFHLPPPELTVQEWEDWWQSEWHSYHQSYYDPNMDEYVYDPYDYWEQWYWDQPEEQYQSDDNWYLDP